MPQNWFVGETAGPAPAKARATGAAAFPEPPLPEPLPDPPPVEPEPADPEPGPDPAPGAGGVLVELEEELPVPPQPASIMAVHTTASAIPRTCMIGPQMEKLLANKRANQTAKVASLVLKMMKRSFGSRVPGLSPRVSDFVFAEKPKK